MNYSEELSKLEQELRKSQPADVLQFGADYFNGKIRQQREMVWNQQDKAKAAGLDLFPDVSSRGQSVFSKRMPHFRWPFGNNDPHQSVTAENHTRDDNQGPSANPSAPASSGDPKEEPHFTGSSDNSHGLHSEIPKAFNANRRTSVSAEAMNPDNFKNDSWEPPRNNLTEEEKAELSKKLSGNFLFRQLDQKSKATVLSALTKKIFPQNSNIITQGDEGDFFYLVESGIVHFYVDGTFMTSCREGSSFGELALMYNSPRAATAVAASEGGVTCWALDRLTFRRLLLENTFNRRVMYEHFLKDIKVLSSLSDPERLKLADALRTEKYLKGDYIIKEGDQGENFYFIESGSCRVLKEGQGEVARLQKGDYFGEVALLNETVRQATVQAVDNVIVATLDKSGFTRLLGPAVEVLRRQDPTAH